MRTAEPLVSVIIPVYDVAPYLREALDSATAQTHGNLQLVIVDDGSADGCASICDTYARDARVTVVHQRNGGLSRARNIGLDLAIGAYVAFLDSDDAYCPDFIRALLEAVTREKADLATCTHVNIRTSGPLKPDDGQKPAHPLREGSYGRADALRALMIEHMLRYPVWNKLFSARCWKDARFPDGHNFEDMDTMYRVVDNCDRVYALDRTLYLHRKRPGSIMDTYTAENIRDYWLACEHICAFIEAHTPGIFTDKELKRERQKQIHCMIAHFVKHESAWSRADSAVMKDWIIALWKEIGMGNCPFRTNAACAVLRFCPGLFKLTYSVCHKIRLASRRSGR